MDIGTLRCNHEADEATAKTSVGPLPGDSTGRVTATLRLRHGTAATLPCLHFHRARNGSAALPCEPAVFTRDHEITQ